MDINAQLLEGCLKAAVVTLDPNLVRNLIETGANVSVIDNEDRTLLHLLSSHEATSSDNLLAQKELVYILTDVGIDINAIDKNGVTALELALLKSNIVLCDALLQCGADMNIETRSGVTIFELAEFYETERDLAEPISNIFHKYKPGLWSAVESSNIGDTRRLINLWCKTDFVKDGKTIRELAVQTGQEDMISLIIGIQSTMRMVFYVLAGNYAGLKTLIQTEKNKLQLDIRNMSNNGSPVLYYVIQRRDWVMAKLLVESGCKVYANMRDESGIDMPVLFSAIRPNVPAKLIEALLPRGTKHQEELLYKLLYKGKTVIEIALDEYVNEDLFLILLERGGPKLLASRNKDNQTARDIAFKLKMHQYVDIIDQTVLRWVANPDLYPERRKTLAIWGYEHFPEVLHLEGIASAEVQDFYGELQAYQKQIQNLSAAIESGNQASFERFSEWKGSADFERNLAWLGRPMRDGLPMLHRAILHNHQVIAEAILALKPLEDTVDSLMDQYHRTGLHYVYGMPDSDAIRKSLLMYGASEHTLDKNGCEPLDFKIKKGSPEMEYLLNRLRFKDCNMEEPTPWADCTWQTEVTFPNKTANHNCVHQRRASNNKCLGSSHEMERHFERNGSHENEEDSNAYKCIIL